MLSVIASEAKQSPGLRGDCFVAKNAPRNDNYTKMWHCQSSHHFPTKIILSIVLPCNIWIERANVVDIDVAVWLRHECRVTLIE